jgi:hypothetical protein
MTDFFLFEKSDFLHNKQTQHDFYFLKIVKLISKLDNSTITITTCQTHG